MPNWSTASVAAEPIILLSRWSVARLFQGAASFDIGYGYRDCARSGRISSPIVGIENGTGRLITQSGRRYALVGSPGIDPDGPVCVAHVTSGQRHHRQAGHLDRVPDCHRLGPNERPGQRFMTHHLIAASSRIPMLYR